MVQFFVPTPDGPSTDEGLYAELATKVASAVPLPPGERIYSINWVHDGETWTATVGEKLHGVRERAVGRGDRTRIERTPLYDGATVLAIFYGLSTMVVTDMGIDRRVRSEWHNPIMAGDRPEVTLFDPPEPS